MGVTHKYLEIVDLFATNTAHQRQLVCGKVRSAIRQISSISLRPLVRPGIRSARSEHALRGGIKNEESLILVRHYHTVPDSVDDQLQ